MMNLSSAEHSSAQAREYRDYLTKGTREAGLSFFAMSAGFLLGFFFSIIYARILGDDLLGVYFLAWTVILSTAILTTFGMNTTLPRYISMYYSKGDKARARGVFIFSIKLTVGLSIVCLVILIGLHRIISMAVFKETRLIPVLLIFSFSLIPLTLLNVLSFTLYGLKEPGSGLFCSEVVQRIARVAIFLLLAYTIFTSKEMQLRGLVLASLLAAIIAGTIALLILSRKASFLLSDLNNAPCRYKEILSYSSMMLLASFMAYIMINIDKIMLGIFGSSADVGIYGIAAQVAILCSFILAAFNAIFSSLISDLYHRDKLATLAQLFSSLTRWIIILTIPFFFWLVLLGKKVLSIFGLDFMAGYSALIVLCIAQMVNSGVGSVGLLLAMTGHQKYVLINTTSMAIINIILNWLLIPRFGILGAGMATATAITLINVVQLAQVKLILHLFPYNLSYFKVIISSLLTFLALFLLRRFLIGDTPAIIFLISSLALCYAISLATILIFGLEEEDSFIIRTILSRFRLISGGN